MVWVNGGWPARTMPAKEVRNVTDPGNQRRRRAAWELASPYAATLVAPGKAGESGVRARMIRPEHRPAFAVILEPA